MNPPSKTPRSRPSWAWSLRSSLPWGKPSLKSSRRYDGINFSFMIQNDEFLVDFKKYFSAKFRICQPKFAKFRYNLLISWKTQQHSIDHRNPRNSVKFQGKRGKFFEGSIKSLPLFLNNPRKLPNSCKKRWNDHCWILEMCKDSCVDLETLRTKRILSLYFLWFFIRQPSCLTLTFYVFRDVWRIGEHKNDMAQS